MKVIAYMVMGDVLKQYVGKRVVVAMSGNLYAKGVLADYNSAVIHITFGDTHSYVPRDKVLMLTGDL